MCKQVVLTKYFPGSVKRSPWRDKRTMQRIFNVPEGEKALKKKKRPRVERKSFIGGRTMIWGHFSDFE